MEQLTLTEALEALSSTLEASQGLAESIGQLDLAEQLDALHEDFLRAAHEID